MEQRESKKVVRLYYGFQFFFSMLLWTPIFYEYQKQIGLNDGQIFGIQSIYYLAFCLLEIPTGLIADLLGHRKCMEWGAILCALSNAIPIFFPSYLGFVGHFVLIALARSLVSGASSAYLYQYLSRHQDADLYKPAEGNARAYGLVGKLFGFAAIGPLMTWHLSAPYVLTTVLTAIAIPYAFSFPEVPLRAADSSSQRKYRFTLKDFPEVFKILSSSPILLWVMIQGIAIFVLTRIVQINLFQPILILRDVGLSSHGLILSAMTVFEAAGAALPANAFYKSWTQKIKWASDLNQVSVLTFGLAASILLIALSGKVGTIAALCIFSWITGISFPVQRQLVNDVIKADQFRATFLSVESILDRAVVAGVAGVLGGFVANGKVPFFLELSAGMSFVLILTVVIKFGLNSEFSRGAPQHAVK